MSAAVCLRCDWTGETKRSSCPRCGVRLFRPVRRPGATRPRTRPFRASPEATRAAAAEQTRSSTAAPREPSTAHGETYDSLPDLASGPAVSTARVWPKVCALAVTALLLVRVVISSWTSWTSERAPTSILPTRESGRLVYATDVAPKWQRLWTVDLASAHVTRGPRIPETSDLLAGWGESWIGFTSGHPNQRRAAYILTGLGSGDRPHRIAAGDLVTWDSTGRTVVAIRQGSGTGSCGQAVSVTVVGAGPWRKSRVFSMQTLCREVLSVAAAGAFKFHTRASGDSANVLLEGFLVSLRVLHGYALQSASPSGDLLVSPIEKLPAARNPIASYGASGRLISGGPSELFGLGHGRPLPIMVGGHEFGLGRVLAWAPDGAQALVVGQAGKQRGVFLIQTVFDDTAARLLGRFDVEAAGGTFTEDGTAYVVQSGRLFRVTQGGLMPVSLPKDAPLPAGPIAWLT
jgi:hypothetical protein